MYKELLDESNDSKKIRQQLLDSSERITALKVQLKKKKDLIVFSRRKIELFEFVLQTNTILLNKLWNFRQKHSRLLAH